MARLSAALCPGGRKSDAPVETEPDIPTEAERTDPTETVVPSPASHAPPAAATQPSWAHDLWRHYALPQAAVSPDMTGLAEALVALSLGPDGTADAATPRPLARTMSVTYVAEEWFMVCWPISDFHLSITREQSAHQQLPRKTTKKTLHTSHRLNL